MPLQTNIKGQSGYGWAALFDLTPRRPMIKLQIPSFCQPCIVRLQAACPHLHTSFIGGWHVGGGDYWENITEICIDCGANLDALVASDYPTQSNSHLPQ